MVMIYELVCKPTNEAYVGCTAGKIAKRMREHRCLLKAGKHSSIRLQELWLKYGHDSFVIQILESLPESCGVIEKRERELYWMRKYMEEGKLLNENFVSFAPPSGAQQLAAKKRVENGYRPSPESNEKRRLAQLGIPKGHGAKISATKRAKNR